MSVQKNNLCFIGAGFHSSRNIYPSAVEAGVNIKGIATRNLNNSIEAIRRFGSKGNPYDDYKVMLENEPCDGVVIVAQPRDQYRLALDCIREGKNVFVDKPLGWNEEEAKSLAKLAKEKNVIAMVGFMKRYAPSYKKLKDIIEKKDLGEVVSFDINFCVDATRFCKTEEDYLKLAAIHIVDLIRYLFGEVKDLCGFNNNDVGINQSISFKMYNGSVGNVHLVSMPGWTRESENLTVSFDGGFVKVEEINTLVLHRNNQNTDISFEEPVELDYVYTPSMTPMSGGLRDIYLRGFVGEIKHFVECIAKGMEPLSNCDDNIKTMELCDRILDRLNR